MTIQRKNDVLANGAHSHILYKGEAGTADDLLMIMLVWDNPRGSEEKCFYIDFSLEAPGGAVSFRRHHKSVEDFFEFLLENFDLLRRQVDMDANEECRAYKLIQDMLLDFQQERKRDAALRPAIQKRTRGNVILFPAAFKSS